MFAFLLLEIRSREDLHAKYKKDASSNCSKENKKDLGARQHIKDLGARQNIKDLGARQHKKDLGARQNISLDFQCRAHHSRISHFVWKYLNTQSRLNKRYMNEKRVLRLLKLPLFISSSYNACTWVGIQYICEVGTVFHTGKMDDFALSFLIKKIIFF